MLIIYHSQITDRDVLCGRGGLTNHHEGNRRFRSIVADHQGEYMTAKKHDKADIARRIVGIIREEGGRFLKSMEGKASSGGGRWVEVGDQKAREKTSQALREGLDVRHSRFVKPPKTTESGNGNSSRPETHSTPRKRIRSDSETIEFAATVPSVDCDMPRIGTEGNDRCESPALISEAGSATGSDDYDPLFFLPFDFDYGDTVTQYELDLPQITNEDCENVVAV